MNKRFYIIDILRTCAFYCIMAFHSYNFIYWQDWVPSQHKGTPFYYIISPAYYLVISGFIVLAISFFLMGHTLKKLADRTSLKVLLAIGTLLLFVTQGDRPFVEVYLEWDIYHLLIAGTLSLFIIDRSKMLTYVAGILGFILLCIPFWEISFFQNLPLIFQHPLIGVCDEEGRGGWALLPWIGLIWFSFGFGKVCLQYKEMLKEIPSRQEYIFICAAVFILVPYWGAYHSTTIGYNFPCFVHRQNPLNFWSEMFFVFYLMRLSLVTQWNDLMEKNRGTRFISNLYINKKFGLCYLIHLLILSIASIYRENLQNSLFLFNMVVILLFPLTEIFARLTYKYVWPLGEKISKEMHRKYNA